MRPTLFIQGRVAVASAEQDVELVLLEQFLVMPKA
jgi:hypothetical protein